MTELGITEAGAVQFPMVRHAAEVGWTPLSPKDALAMRGGEAGLLFRGVLEELFKALLHKLMTGEGGELDLAGLGGAIELQAGAH